MTRQGQILQVIENYIAVHGCSPSNREIAAAAGLKSPSTVLRHLKQLKADGYVTYLPGVPRTVRVLRSTQVEQILDARDPDKVVWVPFVGPKPREMAAADQRLLLLQIIGDSMTGSGIFPGDWAVVLRPHEQPHRGKVIAVLRQVQPGPGRAGRLPDGDRAGGAAALLQVALVILLGPVEGRRGHDLGDDRPLAGFLLGVT
jgi:repressor LexA